jgi:hypothetical protein
MHGRTAIRLSIRFTKSLTEAKIQQQTLKGIVSRDFGTIFLILLDRFEGRNRAGSGLFFILMTFSCLNFKKLCLCGKDPSE